MEKKLKNKKKQQKNNFFAVVGGCNEAEKSRATKIASKTAINVHTKLQLHSLIWGKDGGKTALFQNQKRDPSSYLSF